MRLHLKYKRKDFDPRILNLTERFFETDPWHGDDAMKGRLYDTWLHGACMAMEIPFANLVVNPNPKVSRKQPGQGFYDKDTMTIYLVKFSVISLFHQFFHHQRATTKEGWTHTSDKNSAQAWACSLMYVLETKKFRKAVRKGRVVGVKPADLLRTRPA